MRNWVIFILLIAEVLALVAIPFIPACPSWVEILLGIAAILTLVLLWQSLLKPNRIVMRGLELIASQDFNNRLTPTGLKDPDKIVNLFNTMIDKLRSERTKNLEQENFLQQLTKASPMGVLMLDFDRAVTMTNPAFLKITCISSEKDILGKKLDAIGVSLVGEMLKVELGKNAVIRDGDVMMYRCYHLSFIQTGFKREFYLLESLTEEVIKAERAAYEKVIRTISHEVNNTMGGVRSVIQTISDTTDDADTIEVLESCDNRCEQMCAFVSSYADVVRLPEPLRQDVDLNEEVSKLLPFLRMSLKEGVSIEFNPSENPAIASIDTNMIQQALVNIVKNANESITDEHGMIWISVMTEQGRPTIEIANNGKPITDEVSHNLFRPFYTTKKEGRGIGLTLTAEILNRHNARFRLWTDPQSTTRFRIIF